MNRSYPPRDRVEAAKLTRIRETLAYQEQVAWSVTPLRAKYGQIHGYVQVTAKIYLAPKTNSKKEVDLPYDRGDLDNYMKSLVDGLQYGQIFAPKPGCKKGNDKAVIRYGPGTGIYMDSKERVELILEQITL